MLNIRADQVHVDDLVFNRFAYHERAAWERVWRVDILPTEVRLYTGLDHEHPTIDYLHPAEGVAVERRGSSCTR
jgi:hypothetical protein